MAGEGVRNPSGLIARRSALTSRYSDISSCMDRWAASRSVVWGDAPKVCGVADAIDRLENCLGARCKRSRLTHLGCPAVLFDVANAALTPYGLIAVRDDTESLRSLAGRSHPGSPKPQFSAWP